jgi:Arc/MetJ family transcription regulator
MRTESFAVVVDSRLRGHDEKGSMCGGNMRTTLELDDDLVAKAEELTGVRAPAALVRVALQALIERESARRLVKLGGTDPEAEAPPRR